MGYCDNLWIYKPLVQQRRYHMGCSISYSIGCCHLFEAIIHGFFHNVTCKKRVQYIIILLLPFLALPACRLPITLINGVVYNSWTDSELTHGAFPKVMKHLYAIDMEEPTPYTSIGREKIEKVYEIKSEHLLQYKILWMR